jgi:uncharacterized membrane protein
LSLNGQLPVSGLKLGLASATAQFDWPVRAALVGQGPAEGLFRIAILYTTLVDAGFRDRLDKTAALASWAVAARTLSMALATFAKRREKSVLHLGGGTNCVHVRRGYLA